MSADIVLDLPLPPSVNRTRRINWANYREYRQWQSDADKTLMLYKQNRQRPISGPFHMLVEISYDLLKSDPDNIVKCLLDYCVSRELVPDDRKAFLQGFSVSFAPNLNNGCRIILRSAAHNETAR